MPSRPLEPGDPVRLGRFELLGRLGEGGQGVVYLGRGTNPGEERVAVKVLRSTVDAYVLERLARELDAIHQVQPFVTAGVIEASAEGDRRYVVSEFIDGPSLQERVDDRGPLAEGDLQRLAVGTATVLTFDEPQAGGCVGGTVTFTRHGSGLAYRWTDNIEQNTATLREG